MSLNISKRNGSEMEWSLLVKSDITGDKELLSKKVDSFENYSRFFHYDFGTLGK